MKKGSIKNTRINAEVRKEIQAILMRGIKDPRVSPMASITDARVTADLKYCTVYVSVLGDEQAVADTLTGLKSASGYIRSVLAKEVNLRNTPQLTFLSDESAAYAIEITRKIEEVSRKDAEARALRGETEEEEEKEEDYNAEI